MTTLALHELGHTYGLEHRQQDLPHENAKGKMKLDDEDSYCSQCKKYLAGKGILK